MPFEAPITINPYVAAQPSPPIYVNSSGGSADSPFAKPYELNSHGGTGLRTSYFPADWLPLLNLNGLVQFSYFLLPILGLFESHGKTLVLHFSLPQI